MSSIGLLSKTNQVVVFVKLLDRTGIGELAVCISE